VELEAVTSLLEAAEKQLDRTHAFFPRIDGKFAGLLALLSGQVAILFLNLKPSDLELWFIDVFAALFGVVGCAAGVFLFMCAAPHTKGGGGRSLYYFGTIAKRTEADYIKAFRAETDDDRLDDALAQVWRNSEIVANKFNSLKWAAILIVVAAVPWAAALLSVSLIHHTLPALKGG
jgi:hypothetical protein